METTTLPTTIDVGEAGSSVFNALLSSVEEVAPQLDNIETVRKSIEILREALKRAESAVRMMSPPVCGDYPAPCNCDDPETHGGH